MGWTRTMVIEGVSRAQQSTLRGITFPEPEKYLLEGNGYVILRSPQSCHNIRGTCRVVSDEPRKAGRGRLPATEPGQRRCCRHKPSRAAAIANLGRHQECYFSSGNGQMEPASPFTQPLQPCLCSFASQGHRAIGQSRRPQSSPRHPTRHQSICPAATRSSVKLYRLQTPLDSKGSHLRCRQRQPGFCIR
jgi:hypothetical protein